jgi:hypothetical protein
MPVSVIKMNAFRVVVRDDGHARHECRVLCKNSDARTAGVRKINKNVSESRPITDRFSAQISVTAALTVKKNAERIRLARKCFDHP